MTVNRLLIVDDEPDFAEVVAEIARACEVDPVVVKSAKKALTALNEGSVIGIFLDIVMPDMDGIELIGEISRKGIDTPMVFMSGYDPYFLDMAVKIAKGKGGIVIGSLTKPVDLDTVSKLIEQMKTAVRQPRP